MNAARYPPKSTLVGFSLTILRIAQVGCYKRAMKKWRDEMPEKKILDEPVDINDIDINTRVRLSDLKKVRAALAGLQNDNSQKALEPSIFDMMIGDKRFGEYTTTELAQLEEILMGLRIRDSHVL